MIRGKADENTRECLEKDSAFVVNCTEGGKKIESKRRQYYVSKAKFSLS